MDRYDATVALVLACKTMGVIDRAADALRVVDRIVALHANDTNHTTIHVDAITAVGATIVNEPEMVERFGLRVRSRNCAGRIDEMMHQTTGWK